jgi:two-component system sensor histidine kinase ChvG
LVSKLMLMMVVFFAFPWVLYVEFQSADTEKQQQFRQLVQQQGRLISELLRPVLLRSDAVQHDELSSLVARLGGSETMIRVLLLPRQASAGNGVVIAAAAPPVAPELEARERNELFRLAVYSGATVTCSAAASWPPSGEAAEDGMVRVASVVPIAAPAGCWLVVTAPAAEGLFGGAGGLPYWQTLEVRMAGIIYLALALVSIGLFFGVWRSLKRFRDTARRIRGGVWPAGGFAAENRIPELADVAEEFDRMTRALKGSAEDIRRAAEDNAHAFKTPIAILRQSAEPLHRIVPEDNPRGRRALVVIDEAIDRLDQLVTSARQLEETTAELIDPPRQPVDLSHLTTRMLAAYAQAYSGRKLTIRHDIRPDIVVSASEELIESVIANVMDNAVGYSKPGDEIRVELTKRGREARLSIVDQGPGVPEDQLPEIFERYVTLRGGPGKGEGEEASEDASATQALGSGDGANLGIGLWIVRRNLEAIGGDVTAANRPEGGLAVVMTLPLAA